MRRSELRRRTPLTSTKQLARSGGLNRAGRLRNRSRARVAEQADRRALTAPVACQLGPAIRQVEPDWAGCTGGTDAWHERRKAGAGGSRTNPANLIGACNRCNGWLEDHPVSAALVVVADGRPAVVREGDPDWDDLSRRHDRTRRTGGTNP